MRPFTRPVGRLGIDHETVAECRSLAAEITAPVEDLARSHTTVSIERACLRLCGVDGVLGEGTEAVPIPNAVVDAIRLSAGLQRGAMLPFFGAVASSGLGVQETAQAIANGELEVPLTDEGRGLAEDAARKAVDRIEAARTSRAEHIARAGEAEKPWMYLIVATGNIHEDVPQAQAAARNGADVIAVIRSTGQSLLDYVPYGATTDGFAGTFATQENFRLMRAALDEVGEELGRYVRLTNYASGLCMPEIAAMAAMERLDMMLNDCMYGIIFRDINMQRTFVDQHFSRMVHALAGIVINTGEDNYLTTADAVDAAHTVLASQFLNERLARVAGLDEEQMGLGHAFEIDPAVPDQIMMELAHAQLVRECFPRHPLKYMPPTKHMT
ncbi:MAG TPA: lysine 5,6-aminomutase subunit alpha, partial [Actinomycetota bacterium]|nr:lysine 5,6-aminomutase subunit alpha [Actinomycetota bacterium]